MQYFLLSLKIKLKREFIVPMDEIGTFGNLACLILYIALWGPRSTKAAEKELQLFPAELYCAICCKETSVH